MTINGLESKLDLRDNINKYHDLRWGSQLEMLELTLLGYCLRLSLFKLRVARGALLPT